MKTQRATPLARLVDAEPWRPSPTTLSFNCPIHEACEIGIPVAPHPKGWTSNGADFDALTLAPSIAVRGGADGCEWHGFIRSGRFETCGDSR